MKQWIQPKRQNEYVDTHRMKKVKITAESFKKQEETHDKSRR